MELLGRIVRLQVQVASLKVGEGKRLRYDPAPLLPVSSLLVSPGGVLGRDGREREVIDVHHRDHPASKNREDNGVSIGFTAHYDAMRTRFGAHLPDGIAGENILVQTERSVTEDELEEGLVIETGTGEMLLLERILVAEPCVEFTRYALRWPQDAPSDRTVTEALQFLRGGLRGYYATYTGRAHRLRLGDSVLRP